MRLSVVVTCTQPWPEVRGCLEGLVPQAGTADVEIIVADASNRGLDATAAERVTWLRCPDQGPHELRFRGLNAARGDIVAITEDHCDVASDWCRQVVRAHERHPRAIAIAGALTNGATTCAVDRANFLLVHGSNMPGRGERAPGWFPPTGSNVSYKRERVLPLVRHAGDLELVVTPQLWAQGWLSLDESVVVAHSQSMSAAAHLANHFHAARSHAGLVTERQVPSGRRALARDAVAFPRNLLRPAIDAGRRAPETRSAIWRLVPAMTAMACSATAGYVAGIAGPGGSPRRMR